MAESQIGAKEGGGRYDPTARLASRQKRLGGALLDACFAIFILLPAMLVSGVFRQALRGEAMSVEQRVFLCALGAVVFLLLHGHLLKRRGQTIGKALVGIKIIDRNGNVPRFRDLVIYRYLIFYIMACIPMMGVYLLLADALFIFGKERRCLHDHLAGTWVVDV